ncbi:MAG: signal peptide peptidase SppA [Nanoarchaeota archaeon]
MISYSVSWFVKDETISTNKIAIIPIRGMIVSQDASSFYQKTTASSTIIEFLKLAIKNENIKGIVLDINSPGGTVVASKEIAEVVKSSPKPVVAFIHEIGTSGAYWIATAADEIVADPLSITGSIGVTASYLEFSKLFEEYGITYRSLKAGKFKDIGSPFKELTTEEQTLLEQKLDKIHDVFIREVASNRNLTEPAVRALATGIYFLGEEAQELGLIDTLGNKELAINKTKERAGITDAKLTTFKKERSVVDVLSSLSIQALYSLGRGIGEAEVLPLSTMPTI